jgi:hypothetical protein
LDPVIKPTRTDRDRTLEGLRGGLSAGLLTPEEFAERSDAALIVRSLDELQGLVLGLPVSAVRKNRWIPRHLKLALGIAVLVIGLLVVVTTLLTVHAPTHP